MERSISGEPSLLATTLDLIENFAREIPGSLPDGWTSNVLVSLVANKLPMSDYGPYYNYCIEMQSEGESSLDKESQSSYASDDSFEVFFPTIRGVLDFYLDPRLYESSQDVKICEARQPTELIIEESKDVLEQDIEKAVAARGYKLTAPASACTLKNIGYLKLQFESYRHAYKSYKLLSVERKLGEKVSFLLRRINKTVPPAVILRNIPESISWQDLKLKIKELSGVDVLDYVKPFRLRECFNSILTASSVKDCEVVCYHLHKKNIFYKAEVVKCTVHPLSMRTNCDTNFTEYFRPNTLNTTFSKLIPHWEEIRMPIVARKHSLPQPQQHQPQDEEEGEITLQPTITINHYEPRQPEKKSSRSYK